MRSIANWLDHVFSDLRLAARGLWRSPRFTAAVVLTLAIGTGATTALFSVVDAVLIRPLPYPNSDRIVRIRGNGLQAFILFGGPRHFQLSIPEMIPETIYGADAIEVNLRTLVATGALSVAITIGFAGGPALSVWPRHALDALRTGALTTDSVRSRRFRHLLVAAEVAAACVLLSGAITVGRLVENLTAVDIGIDHQNAVTFRLMLPRSTYPTLESRRDALQRIEEEISAIPNVQLTGTTDQLPGAADQLLGGIPLLHETLPQPAEQSARYAVRLIASPDYFRAAGVQLLAGRFFTATDTRATYPVSILNERAARALGARPDELVGARLIVPASGRPNTWSEIVGVVADVMLQGPEGRIAPAVYRPLAQAPDVAEEPWIVAWSSGAAPPVAALRTAVERVNPALPLYNVRTFAQVRADALADRRFAMTMLSAHGVVSFGLAAFGLYAVVAYFVQRRSREFGIRLALGASPASLRRDVLRSGALLALAGAAAGSAVSFSAARVLWAMIPGFGQIEASTVVLVSVALVTMAAVASWLPALTATQVDPVVALRYE